MSSTSQDYCEVSIKIMLMKSLEHKSTQSIVTVQQNMFLHHNILLTSRMGCILFRPLISFPQSGIQNTSQITLYSKHQSDPSASQPDHGTYPSALQPLTRLSSLSVATYAMHIYSSRLHQVPISTQYFLFSVIHLALSNMSNQLLFLLCVP